MQASKIKIGEVYAIVRGEELARLKVTKVVTTRTNNNFPASVVYGRFPSESAKQTSSLGFEFGPEEGPFAASLLLGDYREHAELVAQKEAEKAAVEALRAAEHTEQAYAIKVLSRVVPATSLHPQYSGTIGIDKAGLKQLVEVLVVKVPECRFYGGADDPTGEIGAENRRLLLKD